MGRLNRSRKRRDEMNKIKKERYDAKELIRLKKTLGLIDADGNEVMKEVADVAKVKTSKQIKKDRRSKEERLMEMEVADEKEKGKLVEVVNENTGKVHIYNSKTLKDQHGTYPPWFNARKTTKRMRKKTFAMKQRYKAGKSSNHTPLD